MAARTRPRLYREVLTPVLHRRFTRAASVALILCYIEAVLLGEKSSCRVIARAICWARETDTACSVMVVPHRNHGRSSLVTLSQLARGFRSPRRSASLRGDQHQIQLGDLDQAPRSIGGLPNVRMVSLFRLVVW